MAEPPNYADMVSQAEKAVANTDPVLKSIAFESVLSDLRAAKPTNPLETASRLIQVLSIVVGVIISIWSFNAARRSEAHAREAEATAKELELERRQAEAAKPFLELRQKLYLEAVKAAAVLANPSDNSENELKLARKRFRQLYVAELSLVEGIGVESKMVSMAELVDPKLNKLTKEQEGAYQLAHALRDSLVKSWKIAETVVDNPNR